MDFKSSFLKLVNILVQHSERTSVTKALISQTIESRFELHECWLWLTKYNRSSTLHSLHFACLIFLFLAILIPSLTYFFPFFKVFRIIGIRTSRFCSRLFTEDLIQPISDILWSWKVGKIWNWNWWWLWWVHYTSSSAILHFDHWLASPGSTGNLKRFIFGRDLPRSRRS